MWDPKNRPCNRTPVPGMRNLLLWTQERAPQVNRRYFHCPLLYLRTCRSGRLYCCRHWTWRNYLELTGSLLLRTGSQSIGRCCSNCQGKKLPIFPSSCSLWTMAVTGPARSPQWCPVAFYCGVTSNCLIGLEFKYLIVKLKTEVYRIPLFRATSI